MGQLFAKFWSWARRFPEFKIVVVGLNNAGKTTIVYKLMLGEVVATTPTVGSNVEEMTYKNLKFLMWDLGGQDLLRDSWSTYYTNANAVIFVVDATDRERAALARKEFHRVLSDEKLRKAVVLVYANKQDSQSALSAAQVSEIFALHEIRDREWHIQGCCALTGAGLFEGLDWIASKFGADRPAAAPAPAPAAAAGGGAAATSKSAPSSPAPRSPAPAGTAAARAPNTPS